MRVSMVEEEVKLDAFAMDKKKPIQLIIKGKKKVYIKRQ